MKAVKDYVSAILAYVGLNHEDRIACRYMVQHLARSRKNAR